MADNQKNALDVLDAATAQLVRAVQSNTEAEIRELNSLPSRYTRETGMTEPDLDISPTPYEPR